MRLFVAVTPPFTLIVPLDCVIMELPIEFVPLNIGIFPFVPLPVILVIELS